MFSLYGEPGKLVSILNIKMWARIMGKDGKLKRLVIPINYRASRDPAPVGN
jgi:hypothetical protein